MTDEQMEKFLARAEQMGHSKTHLSRHGSQISTVTLHSIEEVRKIVRPLDRVVADHREEDLRQLVKDRPRTLAEHIESYLYGTGDLTNTQMKAVARGLPVTVQLISEVDRTLPHGKTLVGPSDAPVVWNYGTLNFYGDSYLTVENTYFSMTVQNLVMQYAGA